MRCQMRRVIYECFQFDGRPLKFAELPEWMALAKEQGFMTMGACIATPNDYVVQKGDWFRYDGERIGVIVEAAFDMYYEEVPD